MVLYCGTIITDEGKEKKVNIDFEPFKPIGTTLYHCDNKFHTEALSELLESDSKFGFIIMDGNGALFGTVSGNTREIMHKFLVELPKKHGTRFNALRAETKTSAKAEEDRVLFVFLDYVKKNDTIMFEKSPNWQCSSSSPTTKSM